MAEGCWQSSMSFDFLESLVIVSAYKKNVWKRTMQSKWLHNL